MKHRIFYLFLILVVALFATTCGDNEPTPDVEAIAANIAATAAGNPTDTPVLTPTPKSTNTPTPDVDATVAAAVAATIAAYPTDTPVLTPTPKYTNTPTPDVDATVAAAIAATIIAYSTDASLPEPTNTPAPVATKMPASQLESVILATYTDPSGYFKIDLPDNWSMEVDDGLVFSLNPNRDIAILMLAVPNDKLGMTNKDLELYGKGFLESFFAELGASVEIEKSLAGGNTTGLKFSTSDGQATRRGTAFLSLKEEILFHLMVFADENIPQKAVSNFFDQILGSFIVTYKAPSIPTPLPATPTPLPATPTPLPATSTPLPATPTPLPATSTPLPPPTSTLTPTPTPTVNPYAPQPGRSRIYISNESAEELTFTIDDQEHKIGPNAEYPVDLDAGKYTYTISTPFDSMNGEVSMGPGQSWVVSISGDGSVRRSVQIYP